MKRVILVVLLAVTLAVPFLLRPKKPAAGQADVTLVIITPHNEAIRYEFGLGFQRWYKQQTGRNVFVDWRVIGGTTEIARYLSGEYTASFQNLWTHVLRRPWSNAVETGFANPRVKPGPDPGRDTPAEAARRAFLASDVDCGIDLFFGGGSYDLVRQADAGQIVDCGVLARHPEWFTEDVIPRFFAGEEYWDKRGRWVGTVLSNYGILSNREALAHHGIKEPLTQWEDLADPRLQGAVALSDPTKSSSMAKAFENVIQQEMQERLLDLMVEADRISELDEKTVVAKAVHEGWIEGLRRVQRISANARYFTDSSQKVPIDVADGDCAAGMCIDFYGRQQAEAERRRGGSDRLVFIAPAGGTVSSVDPIGLMRGAKNRAVALAFIDWVLSPEAQKLWAFRPGTPGGPDRYNLRRLPVRRDFYAHEDWKVFRSDPDASPFEEKNQLIYHEEWTGGLFPEMSFIIRVMCLDSHQELAAAWRAIAAASKADRAMEALQDMSAVDYDKATGEIRAALNAKDKVEAVRLATRLGDQFRRQYQRAADLARLKR
ncbi:MAG TPA: extracellular solute-binding protein [Opitutaceae bacterium]|nr:extracellular solute-binding protein [Opitutaceae bacterium]